MVICKRLFDQDDHLHCSLVVVYHWSLLVIFGWSLLSLAVIVCRCLSFVEVYRCLPFVILVILVIFVILLFVIFLTNEVCTLLRNDKIDYGGTGRSTCNLSSSSLVHKN